MVRNIFSKYDAENIKATLNMNVDGHISGPFMIIILILLVFSDFPSTS